MLHHSLTNHRLKLAIAAACKLVLDLLEGLAGNSGVNGHQVGNTGLILLVVTDALLGVGVGDGTLKLLHDHLGRIHQQHTAGVLVLGLGHLGSGIGQTHNASTNLGDERLRNLEHITVNAVKTAGDNVGQLHMLLLILAHRHQIRLIEQNVTSHQAGVSKQTGIDIVGIFGGLILKLGHAAQLTEHRIAIQHPAQLRMLMDMALDEQGVLLGIQTAGDILRQLLQGTTAKISGILPYSDGMQVCHKIEAIILISTLSPVLHRTQIAAQSQITGGLDAGKHPFLRLCRFSHIFTHTIHAFCKEFWFILP